MSRFKIAWRSVQQRALSSSLTGLSMALGVALVISVLVIFSVVQASFNRAAQGYHVIVGPAKTSPLDIVLLTVYHLGSSGIEPLPWSYYERFTPGSTYRDDKNYNWSDFISVAVPYCLGDSYDGFRVIATTPDLFDKLEYAYQRPYKFAQGRNFDAKRPYEAVLGSVAARQTGLKLGEEFNPTHGVPVDKNDANRIVHKEAAFKVVGILEPTGTPNDRGVFINVEGFFLIPSHIRPAEKPSSGSNKPDSNKPASKTAQESSKPLAPKSGDTKPDESKSGDSKPEETAASNSTHQAAANIDDAEMLETDDGPVRRIPNSQKLVTSILLKFKDDSYSDYIRRAVNQGDLGQAVFPLQEVRRLFDQLVGDVKIVLIAFAALVVAVASISILVAMYNSMNDRKRDIAIMRALGAGRGTVMLVVLLEAVILAVGGGLLGITLGHGLMGALSPYIEGRTGITIGMFAVDPVKELMMIPILIVLASIVGFLPALAAYKTDVSKSLAA